MHGDKRMRTAPSIVGLILNFRDAARTLESVRSLLADGVHHILVWDNSEDGGHSATALRDALADDTRVSIELSAANLGFAAGVNRGIGRILALDPDAWILLINNDARLMPGALPELRDALLRSPVASIAYPVVAQNGRISGTVYYQRWFGLLSRRPLPGSDAHASGCCMLIDPARTGPAVFDEDFFMYGEDAELGCRLGCRPGTLLHVPLARVEHEGSATGRIGSSFYEERMVAAHLILARKLARSGTGRVGLLLGRAIALPARALVRTVRQRSLVPLRALIGGWKLAHGHDPLLDKARHYAASPTRQR